MPSRAAHRELTRLLLHGYDGDQAHAVVDSTAKLHGSDHRRDEVHSPAGAVLELLKRGQATPQNVEAVYAHIAQDKMVDQMVATTRLRGAARQFVKSELERTIVRVLRRSRRP